jgi:hypothetical protein
MRTILLLALAAGISITACKTNRSAASRADANSVAATHARGMCGLDEVHEICNGLDDDCNGAIDDNARCPGAQHCVAGRCQ